MKDNWYPKVLLSDDKNPNRLVLGQIGTCQWNLLEENLHLPQELLLCYWWQMGYWVPSRPNLHSDYFQSVTRLCNLSLGECYPKLSCTCNSHQISHSGKLTKHPLTPSLFLDGSVSGKQLQISRPSCEKAAIHITDCGPRNTMVSGSWPDSLLFRNKVGRVSVQWEKGSSLKSVSEQFRGLVTTTYIVIEADQREEPALFLGLIPNSDN